MTTTPATWVTNEVITATKMNVEVRDNITSLIALTNSTVTAWTPTVTQLATITKTVTEARYATIGGTLCAFWVDLALTSAGTASNNLTMTLPLTAVSHSATSIIGSGVFVDTSVTKNFQVTMQFASTTTVKFLADSGVNGVLGQTFVAAGATTAIAVASGDFLRVSGLYVIA